jgi:hypothetical protein
MMGLLLCLVGIGGVWGFGLGLAQLLVGRQVIEDSARQSFLGIRWLSSEVAGLAIVLGIGGTAWALFVWSLLGGSLGTASSVTLAIVGLAWGAITSRALARRTETALQNYEAYLGRGSKLAVTCQVLVLCLGVAALFQALITPQRFWDERATFGLRAAVLFEDRSVWSTDLLNADFVIGHPRYPLLLPLSQQHGYSLLGERNDRWVKLIPPLLYVGMAMVFAGVLSRSRSISQAWLWASVLALVPALMPHDYGFLCSQADAPVACYHGLSVLYLWEGLRLNGLVASNADGRRAPLHLRPFVMAGILAGMAAFTKDEGFAFVAIDAAVLLVVSFLMLVRRPNTGMISDWFWVGKALLAFGIAFLGYIIPWMIYSRYLPMTTEMNYVGRFTWENLVARQADVGWFFQHLWQRMFVEVAEWGATWWLAAFATVLGMHRLATARQTLLLGDIGGALLALLVAGLLSPTVIGEHIGGSSHRFLMQLSPVAILFAVGQLTDDRQKTVSSQEPAIETIPQTNP